MRTIIERAACLDRVGPEIAHQLGGQDETWLFAPIAEGQGRLHRLDDGMVLRLLAGWATFADRFEVAPATLPVGQDLAAPSRLRVHVTHRGSAVALATEIRARVVEPLARHYRRQRAVLRAEVRPPACRAAAFAFIEGCFGVSVPDTGDALSVTAGGVTLPLRVDTEGRVFIGTRPIAPFDLALLARGLEDRGVPVS